MKKSWRSRIARMTGTNPRLDKKVLRLKRSWDEVERLLSTGVKKKKR